MDKSIVSPFLWLTVYVHRIRRLLPKTATVAEFGDSRRFQQLSPFSAPVAEFGDKLLPFPVIIVAEIGDCSLQCGQGLRQ